MLGEQAQVVTNYELSRLEQFLDRVWGQLGIDLVFTRHFLDRVNDPRNIRPITVDELRSLFAKTYKKYGHLFAHLKKKNIEAVLADVHTQINVPFVLQWDNSNNVLDLVSKTVIRKSNFLTRNKKYLVEGKIMITSRLRRVIREEISRVLGEEMKFIAKISGIGNVVVDGTSESEVRMRLAKTLRRGKKDIESVTKVTPDRAKQAEKRLGIENDDDDDFGEFGIGG